MYKGSYFLLGVGVQALLTALAITWMSLPQLSELLWRISFFCLVFTFIVEGIRFKDRNRKNRRFAEDKK